MDRLVWKPCSHSTWSVTYCIQYVCDLAEVIYWHILLFNFTVKIVFVFFMFVDKIEMSLDGFKCAGAVQFNSTSNGRNSKYYVCSDNFGKTLPVCTDLFLLYNISLNLNVPICHHTFLLCSHNNIRSLAVVWTSLMIHSPTFFCLISVLSRISIDNSLQMIPNIN